MTIMVPLWNATTCRLFDRYPGRLLSSAHAQINGDWRISKVTPPHSTKPRAPQVLPTACGRLLRTV